MMPHQIYCDYLEDKGFDTRLLRTQEPGSRPDFTINYRYSCGPISYGDGPDGDGCGDNQNYYLNGDGYGFATNGFNGDGLGDGLGDGVGNGYDGYDGEDGDGYGDSFCGNYLGDGHLLL